MLSAQARQLDTQAMLSLGVSLGAHPEARAARLIAHASQQLIDVLLVPHKDPAAGRILGEALTDLFTAAGYLGIEAVEVVETALAQREMRITQQRAEFKQVSDAAALHAGVAETQRV